MTRLPGQHGHELRKAYRESWKRPYGCPLKVVCDGERGFARGVFAERCGAEGTELDPTCAESSSQNAKTERAGGTWKRIFYKAKAQVVIESEEDLRELVDAVNVAVGERGPYARIFGRDLRLPEGSQDHEEVSAETISRYEAKGRGVGKDYQVPHGCQEGLHRRGHEGQMGASHAKKKRTPPRTIPAW